MGLLMFTKKQLMTPLYLKQFLQREVLAMEQAYL